MASFPIRPITADELPQLHVVHMHAFNETRHSQRAAERLAARFEPDRSLAAFDGSTMVGVAGVYSFRMRVPGAMAPVAGVSMVAVLPSHRRRGILSALMRHQLDGIRDRGEAVAALYASESGIYGRYGYGRASWHLGFTLRAGEGRLAAGAPTDERLSVRICDPHTVRAELAKVYELVMAERPGFFARSDAWWDRLIGDPDEPGPSGPPRCVIAEDDSGPRGYAVYTAKDQWDEYAFLPEGTVEIGETLSTDPAASAAIWSDLLSRDLAGEFRAGMRPVDDPLLFQLADPRRTRPSLSDGLWVRLVDVGRALSQRRYACPVDVVIEVTDRAFGENEGRWRLSAAAESTAPAAGGLAGSCERTAAPADLIIPVEALGAAYLGGTRLGPMAMAGLVTGKRPGAIAALSAAMSWEPAPWCPMIF
jgi:predicted acetyltransferase